MILVNVKIRIYDFYNAYTAEWMKRYNQNLRNLTG
jgi:hypothetical protein